MKSEKILLKKKDFLIVPVNDDLNDLDLENLQTAVLERVAKSDINGVVIDVSSLEAMDIFMAKRLTHLIDLAKVMDVRSILVGIRPAVALTLTDMEISFPGVKTAINLDAGFKMLKKGK